jgi:hypothetical protein
VLAVSFDQYCLQYIAMAVDSLREIARRYPPHGATVAPETQTNRKYKCCKLLRSSSSSSTNNARTHRVGMIGRKRSTLSLLNPEVEDGEEETMVSGWGEAEDMKEDLLKDWGEVLEKWDGKQRDKARPKQLSKLCRKGIPYHLRCQVWQMLSGAAYDPQLLESYRLLIPKESPAENIINMDMQRTYLGHDFFHEPVARDVLYKISKAYSIYDAEVGYCQGLSFIVAVILLQKMPEEQAFAVLIKIMYQYHHRDVFKTNFYQLHLMFYQLDRLLKEYMEGLHGHFHNERVETHMYSSQWFLTIYTAKFPITMVFRVMDVFLCEVRWCSVL